MRAEEDMAAVDGLAVLACLQDAKLPQRLRFLPEAAAAPAGAAPEEKPRRQTRQKQQLRRMGCCASPRPSSPAHQPPENFFGFPHSPSPHLAHLLGGDHDLGMPPAPPVAELFDASP